MDWSRTIFWAEEVEGKRRRPYFNLGAFYEPCLLNGLAVNISTIATLVIADPPAVFFVIDFGVHA